MIVFGEKQKNTIKAPFDYTLEVNEGTPRSGKTTCGVFRYAYYLTITPDENHLVVAYNQEQAYRLIVESDGFGLKHIFGDLCQTKHDDNGDHLVIHTPNGIKKVYYKGGGKADSHKAITGMSLGSVVFCEINLLHMDMIQECFRRTFAAKMRYHLADLNPPAPNHPVIKEVFEVQKTRWQHWTIHDNPILTEERRKSKWLGPSLSLTLRAAPATTVVSAIPLKGISSSRPALCNSSYLNARGSSSADGTFAGIFIISFL